MVGPSFTAMSTETITSNPRPLAFGSITAWYPRMIPERSSR
jgi:hypothetical protein